MHSFRQKIKKEGKSIQSKTKAVLVIILLTAFALSISNSSVRADKAWVTGTVTDHVLLAGDKDSGTYTDLRWDDNNLYELDGDSGYPHNIDIKILTRVYTTPYESYRIKIVIDENDWDNPNWPWNRLYLWVWDDYYDWLYLDTIASSTHSATYTLDSDNYFEINSYTATWIRFTTDPGGDGWDLDIDTAILQAWDDVM